MADSDGKVRIIIDTNADTAAKALDNTSKAFDKTGNAARSASSIFASFQQDIDKNTIALRDMALGGGENTQKFKELAQRTKEYQQMLDNASKTVEKATGSFNLQADITKKLAGAVKGLAGAYLGVQGIKALINYSKEAVQNIREEEIAIKQLNQTLMNAGVYTSQYSSQLQKLANEIQENSNYGNEAVLKAVALGQAYVGNIKISKELTKATVDFASATGMDLEQAFSLVGKSIGSQTNALGRYGISLKKGMTESQKMEAIQKQLDARYRGSANEMKNSSEQLKNALGELSKSFGRILNPAVEATELKLKSGAYSLRDWIDNVRILHSEINKLDLQESQTRYKQLETYLNKLDAKQKKQGYLSGPEKGKYKQSVKDLLEVEAHMDSLFKKEREMAKLSNATGNLRLNDNFGEINTENTKKAKDAIDKLNDSIAEQKRRVELTALTYGTSSIQVQKAFEQYKQLNGQLQSISRLFETPKGAYQELSDKVSIYTAKLRDLAAEQKVGTTDWAEYTQKLKNAQTELENVNKSLEDNGIKIDDVSKRISSSLSSGLISALRSGGSAFDVFSNIAVGALQKVLDKILEMSVITPLLNTFSGGIGGSLLSFFGFKNGGVFKNGNVIPFAKGGLVNKPTLFPMANGGTGLMGEAGTEAVMPLKRMANGKLGVEASGNNGTVINIYNQSNSQIETRKRDNGSMDIIIKRVNEALMNERTSSGFRAAYQREDRKGVQAC